MRQIIRVLSYLKSLYELTRSHHGKLLPWEKILERHSICQQCPHLDGKNCTLCSCSCTDKKGSYFNKLAFPNESCPDTPPRWKAVE
jgi:hypothetical protein